MQTSHGGRWSRTEALTDPATPWADRFEADKSRTLAGMLMVLHASRQSALRFHRMQVRSACDPFKSQPLTALAALNAFCSSAWRCCKASTSSLSSFSLASWDPRFSCKTAAGVTDKSCCEQTSRSIL